MCCVCVCSLLILEFQSYICQRGCFVSLKKRDASPPSLSASSDGGSGGKAGKGKLSGKRKGLVILPAVIVLGLLAWAVREGHVHWGLGLPLFLAVVGGVLEAKQGGMKRQRGWAADAVQGYQAGQSLEDFLASHGVDCDPMIAQMEGPVCISNMRSPLQVCALLLELQCTTEVTTCSPFETREYSCSMRTCLSPQPMVYANEAFLSLTGYSIREVLGSNCRLLQVGGCSLFRVPVQYLKG